MIRLGILILLLCLPAAHGSADAAATTPVPAPAPSEALPAGYQQAVDAAFKEFELGNYLESRARFLDAHTLLPSARTLRSLGVVEFELRNYLSVVDYLSQAISDPRRPLNAEERAEAQKMLAEAQSYLAYYTVTMEPSGAVLSLNHAPVNLVDGDKLRVQVGDYALEARAANYETLRRDLHVTAAGTYKLDLRLTPEARAQESERRPLSKNPYLWTGVGAVVVGAVVAGVLLSMKGHDKAEADTTTRKTLPVPPSN